MSDVSGGVFYSFVDYRRGSSLLVLSAIFVGAVLCDRVSVVGNGSLVNEEADRIAWDLVKVDHDHQQTDG